jgi:hypothetical protein
MAKYRFRKKGEHVQMLTLSDADNAIVTAIRSIPTSAAILAVGDVLEIAYPYVDPVIFRYQDCIYPTAASRDELISRLSEFFSAGSAASTAFSKFMRDDAGNMEANGNYAATAKIFAFKANQFSAAPQYQSVEVNEIRVLVKDTGSIDADKYGNSITVTNGVDVKFKLRGTTFSTLDGLKIKTMADYASHGFSVNVFNFGNSTAEMFVATLNMIELFGKPLRLYAEYDDQIQIELNDSFAALDFHRFKISGIYV